MDYKKMEAHDPAKDSQDTVPALPIAPNQPVEQKSGNGQTMKLSCFMRRLVVGTACSTPTSLLRWKPCMSHRWTMLEQSPSLKENLQTQHVSPPSPRFGPPSRHITFPNTNQEAEEAEPRVAQRSSTYGSNKSH